jgi:hypothetical protein
MAHGAAVAGTPRRIQAGIPRPELRARIQEARERARLAQREEDAATEKAEAEQRALDKLEADEKARAEAEATAKAHADAVRTWLDRQILIGGVTAAERALVERLADDLEAT